MTVIAIIAALIGIIVFSLLNLGAVPPF